MQDGEVVPETEWDGKILGVDSSLEIIKASNEQYKDLFSNSAPDFQYDYWQSEGLAQLDQ